MSLLTYLSPKMIEQPANLPYLSAAELIASNADIDNANFNTLSAYNSYLDNIISNTDIFGNLTVYGAITALSGIVAVNTFVTSTSALSVVNIGTGPALYISQGENINGVAVFVGVSGQEILKINNVEPNLNQPTVVITQGPTNRSLSALGITTLQTVQAQHGTLTTLNATSATVSIQNVTTTNAGTINAVNVNATTVSANALQMPADSYAFFGNMTVYGQINALSGIQNISSLISETSALSVVSVAQAPALYVKQTGAAGSVASFYGNDTEVLRVNNTVVNPSLPGIVVTNSISSNNIITPILDARLLRNFSSTDGMYLNYNSGGSTGADLRLYADGTNQRMIVKADTGNVGIGTSVPNQKLTVSGNISATQNVYVPQVVTPSIDSRLIRNFSSTDGMYLNYNSGGSTAADLRFYANGTNERMIVKADTGNVGIGTSSPTQMLDVVGSIRTSSNILVNSSSPTIYLQDTDQRGSLLHNNGNTFYILRTTGPNSTQAVTLSNGQWPFYTSLENGSTNVGGNFSIQGFNRNQAGTTHDPYTILQIQNTAGAERMLQFVTDTSPLSTRASGVSRWILGANSTPETGSNVGSDFYINGYDDAGTYSGLSFFIKRSSNNVGIGTSSPTDSLHVNGFARAKGFKPDVSIATSTTTLSAGQILGVDTTSSVVSAILPVNPSIGNMVQVFDSHRKWDTNNCIIGSNGLPIEGSVQNLECDVAGSMVTLIYVSVARGWAIVD